MCFQGRYWCARSLPSGHQPACSFSLLKALSQRGTSAPREVALLSPQGSQATSELRPDSLWTTSVLEPLLLSSGGGVISQHSSEPEFIPHTCDLLNGT